MTMRLNDGHDLSRHSLEAAKQRSGTSWLITFADLAALMLAFFALMYSMGEIDPDRWKGTEATVIGAPDSANDIAASVDRVWRNIEISIISPTSLVNRLTKCRHSLARE